MFDLAVEGIRNLSRAGLFRRHKVIRESLGGIADGSNVVFRTAYSPLVEAEGITVYLSGGSISSGSYLVDYDTGTVIFGSAPSAQPQADYYHANLTTREFKQILLDGFDLMEMFWRRGLRISSGSAAFQEGTEDDDHLYVVDSAMADPACGNSTFSQSRAQVALLRVCALIAYLDNLLMAAADEDIDIREDRGLTVKRSHRTPNIERALNAKLAELRRALDTAQAESYTSGEQWGGYFKSPATQGYLSAFEWQEYSKQNDLRALYRYSISGTTKAW